MGAESSKSAASGSNGSGYSMGRRHPPISTRSQSVPSGSGGLGGDDVLDDPVSSKREPLQRHRSSMIVVNKGKEASAAGISQDPLMKKLDELHYFYPLMHDVEKRSGLFGTHNKKALTDIQSKLHSLSALKIMRMYENRLKDHADSISLKQSELSIQIRDTDQSVSTMLKGYSERAKTTARCVERLSKIDDLKRNLYKCQETVSECVAIIDLLNGILPETERLEELNLWADEQASECR